MKKLFSRYGGVIAAAIVVTVITVNCIINNEYSGMLLAGIITIFVAATFKNDTKNNN